MTALSLAGCGFIAPPAVPVTPVTPAAPQSPTPLDSWRSSLALCHTQPLNVVILGDSRSIVDPTVWMGADGLADTFGNKWPDLLAQQLQTRCGSHGTGIVPFLPGAGIHQLNADFYTFNGTYVGDPALGPSQGATVPASMTLLTTSPSTITFTTATAFDHLVSYCVQGPGLNPWTMFVDGSPVGLCGGPAAALTALRVPSSAFALGRHTASLICPASPCEAYGLEALAGTTGASVHNLSIGACAAECFGLHPATQLAFSNLIAGGQHLVILNLVANEPGVGYSTTSFSTSLDALVQHARSLPGDPSLLLIAPLQDGIPHQDAFYPVIPAIATQDTTAYFDMRTQYGTAFLPRFFGPDTFHENDAGHLALYTTVASTLLP